MWNPLLTKTAAQTCSDTSWIFIILDLMKPLFDWHGPVTTHATPRFSLSRYCKSESLHHLCHICAGIGKVSCVIRPFETISACLTYQLDPLRDCKIYKIPTWQLTLHGWGDWRLYKNRVHYHPRLYDDALSRPFASHTDTHTLSKLYKTQWAVN